MDVRNCRIVAVVSADKEVVVKALRVAPHMARGIIESVMMISPGLKLFYVYTNYPHLVYDIFNELAHPNSDSGISDAEIVSAHFADYIDYDDIAA